MPFLRFGGVPQITLSATLDEIVECVSAIANIEATKVKVESVTSFRHNFDVPYVEIAMFERSQEVYQRLAGGLTHILGRNGINNLHLYIVTLQKHQYFINGQAVDGVRPHPLQTPQRLLKAELTQEF